MNVYGEGSVTAYTPSAILVGCQQRAFGISTFIGWGDAPGEFLLYRNDEVVGGARTSDAQRAIQVNYGDSPIMFGPTDAFTIRVEHGSMGVKTMRVNVVGTYF